MVNYKIMIFIYYTTQLINQNSRSYKIFNRINRHKSFQQLVVMSNAKVRKTQPEFIKLDPRKVCRMQIRDLFSGKVRPWVNAKTPLGSTMTRIGTKFIVGFRLSR